MQLTGKQQLNNHHKSLTVCLKLPIIPELKTEADDMDTGDDTMKREYSQDSKYSKESYQESYQDSHQDSYKDSHKNSYKTSHSAFRKFGHF